MTKTKNNKVGGKGILPVNKCKTVYQLFKDRSRWIKGDLAMDNLGSPTDSEDSYACKFCMIGGIYKVYGKKAENIIDKVEEKLGKDIAEWNDASSRRHKDVLDLCRKMHI